jgi:hypothetical protein
LERDREVGRGDAEADVSVGVEFLVSVELVARDVVLCSGNYYVTC